MSWTQPICAARWNQDYGSQGKGRIIDVDLDENGSGDPEQCCYCGKTTVCGIFVRIDPSTVPYPRE
jgi:hypothetical protein